LLALTVAVTGCNGRVAGVPGTPLATVVITTPAPVTTPAAGATATVAATTGNANIRVARPAARQEVKSPVTVAGQANVFEANVQVVIKDAKGAQLAATFATASKGAPEWGDYSAAVPFTVRDRQDATIEVFAPDARDGTPRFTVAVPVVLLPN